MTPNPLDINFFSNQADISLIKIGTDLLKKALEQLVNFILENVPMQ